MTTFEKVVNAIKGFGYPYEPDIYSGDPVERWFTYNMSDDRGIGYADDTATDTLNEVQVHFFMPLDQDFQLIKNQIRERLVSQGFTFPKIVHVEEKEDNIRHMVFTCEILEEV